MNWIGLLGRKNIEPDEPQVIESKSSAPARARGKQDSESQIEKLGSEALEPRRVSVPLLGGEVQAMMTPAYRKMLRKLEDSVELYKLHIKHYHMSPTQFRRRASMLGLLTLFMKRMKKCTTSVVRVVLQLHHRHEPEFQAYDPPTLEMLSLWIMLKFS